jgi:hypothetical protein
MLARILMLLLVLVIAVPVSGVPVFAEPGGEPTEAIGYQPPLKEWYTAPSSDWENESMPLGNGFIGASVLGGVYSESIIINEHTLWSGGPGANANYNGGFNNSYTQAQNVSNLREAQEALQAAWKTSVPAYVNPQGNVVGATQPSGLNAVTTLVNRLKGDKGNFGSYQQLSNIVIADPTSAVPKAINIWANYEHPAQPNEHAQFMFDGSTGTKAYVDNFPNPMSETNPYIVKWEFATAFATKSYRLASGNDSQGRDFAAWKLYASTEATGDENFVLIDTVTGAQFASRQQYNSYTLDVPGSYLRYRIEVSALRTSGQKPQMSEIEIQEDKPGPIPYSNYYRELDIDNSIAKVQYAQGGVNYTREYFVSNPGNFMAVRLTADQAGSITRNFAITSAQSRKTIAASGDTITLQGRPSDHNLAGAETNFSNSLHFAQQLKVVPEGGTLTTNSDGTITVTGANSVLLLSTAGTNYVQSMDNNYQYFDGINPLPAVQGRIAAIAGQSFDTLLTAHKADYKELFDRVKLNLNNVPFPASKTTVQLLAGYRNGTNTDAENRYLETLYYQFGRYLLISSSRPGSLPANLQGIWAEGASPPWSADYHTNINLQMNYWPAEQTNLTETAEPMIKYVQSLVPRGTYGAKRIFGESTRGWTIWHENNIWGNAGPATSDAFFSPEDGAWVAQHIWEHYLFTKDEQFLRDNYALLRDAALFWVDTLWTDERDGKLVVNPSYSPEHGPDSLGATEAQAVVWGIFDEVIQASDILGINTPELAEIKTAQAGLLGPKIGLGGQFQEWRDEIAIDLNGDGGHRHTNHLYGLHPGNQIVAGRSAQENLYVEAMKKTLNTRGDEATGWSKAWKLNFWARVRDGNRAHRLFSNLLTGSTLNNLWDTHAPFQIDGNFGGTAGVTEMMLQSQGGMIELMAAMPDVWTSGAVKGLKARGNVEVDMEWSHAELRKAVLRPAASDNALVVRGTNVANGDLKDKDGTAVAFTKVDENTIQFAAVAGQIYTIDNIRDAAGLAAAKAALEGSIAEAKTKLAAKPATYEYFDRKANADLEAAIALAEAANGSVTADKYALLDAKDALTAAITLFDNRYNMALSISLPSGIYNSAQQVKLVCASDSVEIHYTLDGSTPTAQSPLYVSAIDLPDGKHVLRASAFHDGLRVGTESTATYFVATGTNAARGKTATVSQSIGGYPAGNLVDGNYTNRWASNGNSNYATINYGAPTAIDNIVIVEFAEVAQGTRTTSLRVSTSNNGTDFTDVYTYNRSNPGDNAMLELQKTSQHTWIGIALPEQVTTQYLRLTFTANEASVWEIESYKVPDGLRTLEAKQAVRDAKAIDLSLYRDNAAKTAFTAALTAAEQALSYLNNQAEVDNATKTLVAAVNALERKDALLSEAIRDALMIDTNEFESGGQLTAFAGVRDAALVVIDKVGATQQEFDTAATDLQNAMKALTRKVVTDKSKLILAIKEGEAVDTADFSSADAALNFTEALIRAQNADRRVASSQATIDTATLNLRTAMSIGLFKENPLAAFETSYNSVKEIYDTIVAEGNETDYTLSSWDAFEDALADAAAQLSALVVTREELASTWETLVDAIANLKLRASAGTMDALQVLVDAARAIDTSRYSADKVAVFTDALASATAILGNPADYTDDDVLTAGVALVEAINGLDTFKADKANLKSFIDYAKEIIKDQAKYIPASIDNLQTKLTAANLVYADNAATQADVDAAAKTLLEAISKVYEKGDKAALQALYNLVSRYTSATYTPGSWTAFGTALTAADQVLKNVNAIATQVDKAYTDLVAATVGLTRRANSTALNATIQMAQIIVDNIDNYIPSTVVGLADELAAAKVVAGNLDATQAQVNAAATSLNTRVLAARLKPDMSGLLSSMQMAGTFRLTEFTEASAGRLSSAMEAGNALLSAPLEKVEQAAVNAVTAEIQTAITGLVPRANVVGSEGKTAVPVAKTVIPRTKVLKITTSAKSKIVVKWAKAPSSAKVTGYQVQYRVKGTSKWKTKTVSAKSASLTIKSLKKNAKYQIRVRACRTVSGQKYYGAWSKAMISKKLK